MTLKLTLFCLCLAFAASAQLDLGKLQPVDQQVVRCFVNARCATHGDSTFNVGKFPSFFRTQFISKFYSFNEVIPFRIYYAEDVGQPLYYIQHGCCRGFSITCPLPQPGFYFVRFFNEAKPALVEIDARTLTVKVKMYGACEIHD